jgi:hypothetical protein
MKTIADQEQVSCQITTSNNGPATSLLHQAMSFQLEDGWSARDVSDARERDDGDCYRIADRGDIAFDIGLHRGRFAAMRPDRVNHGGASPW